MIISHTKKVSNVLNNYNIPDIQRNLDSDHCREIYEFENNYYNNFGTYCLHGTITVAINNNTNIEYLLDGQHRMSTYKTLQNEYPERALNITTDYYTFTDNEDLEYIYKIVNSYKINEITQLSINTYKILNEYIKYISSNFKDYIKTSQNPHKPSINLDFIKESIIESKLIEKIPNSLTLINMTISLNKFYGTLSMDTYKSWGIKNIHSIFEKINTLPNKFYLGIYRDEWIYRLIDLFETNREPHQIQHICKNHRICIPKVLRKQVWNNTTLESNCYCCNDIITYDNFECGHIIPVVRGGLTILNNLKPICRTCNNDMGIQNLEEYKNIILNIS